MDQIDTKFEWAVDVILAHEGGLVDDPQDDGKLTNYGIALGRHPELTRDDVLHMTKTRARNIYRTLYWNPIRGDDLPRELALCTFDAAVMSGVLRGARWLQQVVEVPVDEHVGPITIAAALECLPSAACSAYTDTRLAFLRTLATWPRFGKGWEARCVDTLRAALS